MPYSCGTAAGKAWIVKAHCKAHKACMCNGIWFEGTRTIRGNDEVVWRPCRSCVKRQGALSMRWGGQLELVGAQARVRGHEYLSIDSPLPIRVCASGLKKKWVSQSRQ